MSPELQKIFEHHHWRHAIEIEAGLLTPGYIKPDVWDFLGLPKTLHGKRFLDVGANDGLFTFEAERRGAKEVIASDVYLQCPHGMREGWIDTGIMLAREVLKSKVQIHRKGVYHLYEIGHKFDVVLVNNLINWLEDIELAMKQIAGATNGTLYLGDGFLTGTGKPLKMDAQDEDLRYFYNLPFIIDLLERNGFIIDSINKLNYQRIFVKDYLSRTEIVLDAKTPIYKAPHLNAEYTFLEKIATRHSTYVHKDFFHLNGLGWVNQGTVKSKKNEPSIYYRLSHSVGLEDTYYQYLSKRAMKQSDTSDYIIKASKNQKHKNKL